MVEPEVGEGFVMLAVAAASAAVVDVKVADIVRMVAVAA